MSDLGLSVFSIIAQSASSFSTVIAVIGVLSAMLIMSVFVTRLGDMILPKPAPIAATALVASVTATAGEI